GLAGRPGTVLARALLRTGPVEHRPAAAALARRRRGGGLAARPRRPGSAAAARGAGRGGRARRGGDARHDRRRREPRDPRPGRGGPAPPPGAAAGAAVEGAAVGGMLGTTDADRDPGALGPGAADDLAEVVAAPGDAGADRPLGIERLVAPEDPAALPGLWPR